MSFASSRPRAPRASTAALSSLGLVAIGGLVSLILSWPMALQVWHTGTFLDTDDAMRMVQVRAWLSGQPWFDLTAHRLDPPDGVLMHWSRVIDVPLALLIRSFMLVTDRDKAELLTRLVFPLGLQIGLIAATIFVARVLFGPTAALPAMILIVTNGFQFGQFVPGRIDHHAPQITLLMLMTGFSLDVILRARVKSAILAAFCIAGSMAISLENLPFIGIVVAALVLDWAHRGSPQSQALRAFGVALAVFATAFFAATVPPSRYLVVSTDAFALPHLLAAILGGGALVGLTTNGSSRGTVGRRLIAVVAFGTLVILGVAGLCPGVVSSPYAEIDPVVRAVWLSRVTEALPLPTVLRLHPQAATLVLGPLLAGLAAAGVAAWREPGTLRTAWLLVGALTLAGTAAACWEVRVVSSITPLAVLGGVWVFGAVLSGGLRRGRRGAAVLACLSLVVFSPWAWIVVPVPDESASVEASAASAARCREAGNLAPLAQLAPGVIFAPIDSGSHLLAHTAMSVIGAPYHRNNVGNRAVIDGFSADPAAAEQIVKRVGARYVALCPGQVQAEALTSRNPQGLAAQILAGHIPVWLEPLPLSGTTYKVFAVRH